MAATAGAAVASSFTPTMHSFNSIRSKTWPSDPSLKIPSSRFFRVLWASHSFGFESILIGPFTNKRRGLKMAAAVAQEEAAVMASEEEATILEQDEGMQGDQEETSAVEAGAAESSSVNTKLYFGNLPYNVDSAQLAGIIQDHASPEMIEVLYDRETGRSRGFAFVTMSTIEDCHTVIENLDGRECGGRTLRVNFSDKPKPKEQLYPETEHKLFVGNLAWSVTSESLTEAFREYGNVVGARVLYDGETGRSRGYGFVCYRTKAEMESALNSLNGVELEGRPMRVSLAEGKRQ